MYFIYPVTCTRVPGGRLGRQVRRAVAQLVPRAAVHAAANWPAIARHQLLSAEAVPASRLLSAVHSLRRLDTAQPAA